jgi:hypothetical protein
VTGETDLEAMLPRLSVSRRPGTFVVATVDGPVALGDGIHALLIEDEGTTVVATVDVADRHRWPYESEWAWLTLDVHSALEAVGLTAVVSGRLAERGIACNILAGRHHDHLLVPAAAADDAIGHLTTRR